MHVQFMLYGTRENINKFLNDMEAEKYILPMQHKETGHRLGLVVSGSIRLCPFGVYEYVFPKEYEAKVLATLGFQNTPPYGIGKVRIAFLRKLFKSVAPPKDFSTDDIFRWDDGRLKGGGLAIIPIGVRYDAMFEEQMSESKGYVHEAL